eukprot:2643964-Amphidinium_carterae.3
MQELLLAPQQVSSSYGADAILEDFSGPQGHFESVQGLGVRGLPLAHGGHLDASSCAEEFQNIVSLDRWTNSSAL